MAGVKVKATLAVATLLVVSTACADESGFSQMSSVPGTTLPASLSPNPCEVGDLGELPSGATCRIDIDGDESTPRHVEFAIPSAGWVSFNGAAKDVEDEGGLQRVGALFLRIDELTVDACVNHRAQLPSVGSSVADLADAVAALPPFEVTSPPAHVTAFGYSGTHVEVRVPPDQPFGGGRFEGCQEGQLQSWIAYDGGGNFYGYVGPGDTDEYWILDVDGSRFVVIAFTSATASGELVAERQEILDSVVIKP